MRPSLAFWPREHLFERKGFVLRYEIMRYVLRLFLAITNEIKIRLFIILKAILPEFFNLLHVSKTYSSNMGFSNISYDRLRFGG